jgi:hypothetical protein
MPNALIKLLAPAILRHHCELSVQIGKAQLEDGPADNE